MNRKHNHCRRRNANYVAIEHQLLIVFELLPEKYLNTLTEPQVCVESCTRWFILITLHESTCDYKDYNYA